MGFPFLNKFNPKINWATNEIVGEKGVQILPEEQSDVLVRILQLQNEAVKHCGEPPEGQSVRCIIRKVSFAQQWAAAADKPETRMTTAQIPSKYQRHWKVFDEECAKRYPPSRTENMRIKLLPNAPQELDCKIYPLNQRELETLRKYLACYDLGPTFSFPFGLPPLLRHHHYLIPSAYYLPLTSSLELFISLGQLYVVWTIYASY